MAKGALYWRHKKDGKWTYQRISSGNTEVMKMVKRLETIFPQEEE